MKSILSGLPMGLLVLALTSQAVPAAPFSFETLKASARQLAAAPHVAPADDLDPFWKNLGYDQHREIRFKMSQGLWINQQLPFSIDFFHPGWTAKRMVDLFEVDRGQAIPLAFDRSHFDYGKQSVPPTIPAPRGYAGWRARCHLNTPSYMDEFLVFLGASYFRATPASAPYGASARGLAINSGLPGVAEEFPDFRAFYLEKPGPDAQVLRAWALLESESVAGAYQFAIAPGSETVMDVEAEITLRQPVQQLGLAPFSTMFWFGEGTYPKPLDFRPEVHDSDGVLMELESGRLHFRPLEQTRDRFRHCVFTLDKPRSWSLVQRDRLFGSYQDSEAHYHDRPSVRVEPSAGFDQGKLHLVEMPTLDESNDNVILLWEPVPRPAPGQPFQFRYRLRWTREPAHSGLFEVRSTRVGTPAESRERILLAVDFARPLQPEASGGDSTWVKIAGWKPVIALSQSSAKLLHAGLSDLSAPNADDFPSGFRQGHQVRMPQVIRAFFVIDPGNELDHIDLTCELQNDRGETVSERWLYLWMRPG